jgi:anti-anti-sigma factor
MRDEHGGDAMEKTGIEVTVVDSVVCVFGELDICSARSLHRALAAVEPPKMVDMSGVAFMDSSGLNVLLAHYRYLVRQGGVLRVVAMSPAVERLLEVTGLVQTLSQDSTLLEVPMGASRGAGAVGGGMADTAPHGASSGSSPIEWR